MVTVILSIITFGLGLLIGSKANKHKLIQIGGDNAYQIGIVNNTENTHKEDEFPKGYFDLTDLFNNVE